MSQFSDVTLRISEYIVEIDRHYKYHPPQPVKHLPAYHCMLVMVKGLNAPSNYFPAEQSALIHLKCTG